MLETPTIKAGLEKNRIGLNKFRRDSQARQERIPLGQCHYVINDCSGRGVAATSCPRVVEEPRVDPLRDNDVRQLGRSLPELSQRPLDRLDFVLK